MSETGRGRAAIVLAAGAASRMGRVKQLLPFRGEPLVARAIRAARTAVCRPVIVVLGAHAEAIGGVIDPLEVLVKVNQEWRSGLASSIRMGLAGLLEAAPDIAATFLLLSDQPYVDAVILDRLGAALESSGLPAAACRYGGIRGVPALFRGSLFDELRRLRGDEGARRVLSRDPRRVALVDFPPGAVDVDTPADAARLHAVDRFVGVPAPSEADARFHSPHARKSDCARP